MTARLHTVELNGSILQRGFWLYAWVVVTPDGHEHVYVGRTGDSSSPNAQSPFVRMGQHLGSAANSRMLSNHLERREVRVEDCELKFVAYGPVLPEVRPPDMDAHKVRRDQVAAIERQLAEDLAAAGYDVMNTVTSRKPLDPELYAPVRAAFCAALPQFDAHRP